MISNQVLQTAIDELRVVTKIDLAVYDPAGSVVVSTADMSDLNGEMIRGFAESPADSQMIGAHHLLKISDEGEVIYILAARGFGDDVYMVGRIAVGQIKQLMVAYKERYDRNNFFQNLLLDNMLLVDIYNRAKKLHIETTVPRVVFLVETEAENDGLVTELLKNLFTTQSGDYVTAVDESNIIVVKQMADGHSPEDMEQVAETIVDMVNTEAMIDVKVAYGTVVDELKDVSKSYKEAKMALDVGSIFYAGKKVIAYSTLGIGRLIYQLPENLCRIFMKEIFGEKMPEEVDDEMLTTIDKFFENSLNVSETSRQLFVHRNTLVYRIEKLQKATGLDVRVFDDALTFKIALMVASYMKYIENMK